MRESFFLPGGLIRLLALIIAIAFSAGAWRLGLDWFVPDVLGIIVPGLTH